MSAALAIVGLLLVLGVLVLIVRGHLAQPDPFDFDFSDTKPMEDSKQ